MRVYTVEEYGRNAGKMVSIQSIVVDLSQACRAKARIEVGWPHTSVRVPEVVESIAMASVTTQIYQVARSGGHGSTGAKKRGSPHQGNADLSNASDLRPQVQRRHKGKARLHKMPCSASGCRIPRHGIGTMGARKKGSPYEGNADLSNAPDLRPQVRGCQRGEAGPVWCLR